MTTRRTFLLVSLIFTCVLVVAFLMRHQFAPPRGPSSDRVVVSDQHMVLDRNRSAVPFIFVYMYPKYPLPGEAVIGGLKVAVWLDGKVVRARSGAEVGTAYVEGRLEPEQIGGLTRTIEQAGILATPSDESAPLHEASDLLKIRTQGRLQAWSHSAPNKENALVKRIEEALMTIDIPNVSEIQWETPYPSEWDK